MDGSFKAFLRAVKEAPAGSGCMLLGDTFTFANTRSQRAFKKAMQEATEDTEDTLDAFVAQMMRPVGKLLEPIRDRIWGVLRGNHGWRFRDDTTIESRIADVIGAPYSDGMFVLALRMHPKAGSASDFGVQCNIIAHHGSTGSQTRGGDINHILKHVGYFGNAHIVVEGHTHDLYCVPAKPTLMVSSGKIPTLKAIVPWVARCGSAKAHFNPGAASWEENRMFAPSLPGHAEFQIWLERDVSERREVAGKLKGGDRAVVRVEGRAVPYQGRT